MLVPPLVHVLSLTLVIGIVADLRAPMAVAFGNDRPAALIEDAVAILGAVLVASSL
jgi:uncharacterized membrane protein